MEWGNDSQKENAKCRGSYKGAWGPFEVREKFDFWLFSLKFLRTLDQKFIIIIFY